ncbi:alkaline shock response membrane anchor protein AmaP [Laceyella sacchari]|uniref:Alkaline shock response membrane anchor protein AmaP n=1 Tax=Laceyella sacchari TaxID=37482 RepID=A0ABY5U371_LACSH|nr:alkaline shock response membrane anchor protein AmaP [Laceyella sacchari]UWE03095.1 alkaline shock response membrane anchor protein AmaP [Laceyella sacchari]
MRTMINWILRLAGGLIVSTLLWIAFIYYQLENYAEPDQVYLMGTPFAYGFVFLFLCGVVFFVIAFFRMRQHPQKLRRTFLVFASLYLVSSPLVILAFDNYLLVTPKGIAYNTLFSLDDAKVKRWRDIDQVVLDYDYERWPFHDDRHLRLKYMVYFKDNTMIYLNGYNSPLYKQTEFEALHRTILNNKIRVKTMRPLPPDVTPDSFIYKMYHAK